MKKSNLFKSFFYCAMAASAITFTACDDDNNGGGDDGGDDPKEYFNIVLGVGDDGNDGVMTQASTDLTTGSISFKNFGLVLPSDRTARVITSDNGKFLYSLDYGGGTLTKYETKGGQDYNKLGELGVGTAVGSNNPRWGQVSNDMALLHNISVEHKYTDAEKTQYDYSAATASLVGVKLGGADGKFEMGSIQKLEIPLSDEDKEKNYHIWRIDAPVVHNGKVYYGVSKRYWDFETASAKSMTDYPTTTLVADYPSLTNLKTISSTQAKGENYGYRTPSSHVDEKGDIYQVVGSGEQTTVILRIRNEEYDNSYAFDLSKKLGQDVGSLGWFYVANGIGYVLYYDYEIGQAEADSAWGIARVDIYNQTAVKMNIPGKLWLRQYQKGIYRDGKFYMALAPVGEEGKVYIFDPTSTSPDGFTTGATLENLGGQFYIGIY